MTISEKLQAIGVKNGQPFSYHTLSDLVDLIFDEKREAINALAEAYRATFAKGAPCDREENTMTGDAKIAGGINE